jgi:hypothetical protein
MVHKFSISVSEWIYDKYIRNFKGNRSKFLEEMIVKGISLELGEYEQTAAKQVQLIKDLKSREYEIERLTLQLNALKERLNKKKIKDLTYYNIETGERVLLSDEEKP